MLLLLFQLSLFFFIALSRVCPLFYSSFFSFLLHPYLYFSFYHFPLAVYLSCSLSLSLSLCVCVCVCLSLSPPPPLSSSPFLCKADSCFGQLVIGEDVVNRMKHQPGASPPSGEQIIFPFLQFILLSYEMNVRECDDGVLIMTKNQKFSSFLFLLLSCRIFTFPPCFPISFLFFFHPCFSISFLFS